MKFLWVVRRILLRVVQKNNFSGGSIALQLGGSLRGGLASIIP